MAGRSCRPARCRSCRPSSELPLQRGRERPSRRLVDRCRRGPAGSTAPRIPDAASPHSVRRSARPVADARPTLARRSRLLRSAQSVISSRCSSVAGSRSIAGSWSGASLRGIARPAGSGPARRRTGTPARVSPHGIRTCSTWPVSISVRRSWTGRRQASFGGRVLDHLAGHGTAVRSARVVRRRSRQRPRQCPRCRVARRSRTGAHSARSTGPPGRPGPARSRRPGRAHRCARRFPS